MGKTILGKVGFTPCGEWVQGAYSRLDLVSYLGSSFVSLEDNNTTLLTDASKWMVIARKGDKGDAFTYDDFTPEQLAKLKGEKGDAFIYDNFTPEQIEGLRQPATDAAKVARDAAAEALNVPKIQEGYFWLYDVEQKKYIKTNSPATGKSPKAVDGIWWEYNDEIGDYVSTNISASSDYELTKTKVEAVLTEDITSHNHATQLAEALANYVQVVAGKQLSTEDFTTELKNKLVGLENYDDAAVLASISTINQRIETLLGGSASSAIDTFHEIEAFLAGITDTQSLTGLLADLKAEIIAFIPTKLSQLSNDNNTVRDANYVHTDNDFTTDLKNKLAGVANNANNYSHPAFTARSSGLYKVTVNNQGHVTDVIAVAKADITSLGIPSQDTTYGVATPTANGLMSGIDKARLDDAVIPTDVFTVTALTALSPTKYSQKFTYTTTTVQAINFSSVPKAGFELMLDILNSTASPITQIIPNAAAWQCEETSLVIPAGKVGSISIRYIHGKYCVSVGL